MSEEPSKPARTFISKKLRFEVFKRDSFTCQYCGQQAPNVVLHLDHVRPISDGGTTDILNLITACVACNSEKGARYTTYDFLPACVLLRLHLEEEKLEIKGSL